MNDSVQLESDPRVAGAARAFAAGRLAAWEASDRVDDVLVIVSELVANAVLHARTAIQLRVRYDGQAVRVEVQDENSRFPTPASCPLDATSGRGLRLVGLLASAWGVEHRGDGKVVWAEVGGSPCGQDELGGVELGGVELGGVELGEVELGHLEVAAARRADRSRHLYPIHRHDRRRAG